MRKILLTLILVAGTATITDVHAQRIEEACEIIGSSIKDNQYKEFTIDGSGFLSYLWSGSKDSETVMNIDLIQITISKEITPTGYKVWLNCIDGVNCISEKGRVGNDENFYGEYNKTYLPAKSENEMNAIYTQLDYLLRLANEIR